MIGLSPERLIAAANAFVGLREQGHNRGQMVELMLMEVGQLPGAPWCAAFVHHVGYWSHFDHVGGASSWPLPRTASCWELGEFARGRQAQLTDAAAGDVFLVYDHRLRRFAHTGIVVAVNERYELNGDLLHLCTTIEGNSNEDGAREGIGTVRRTRNLSRRRGDRFIRWTNLSRHVRAA